MIKVKSVWALNRRGNPSALRLLGQFSLPVLVINFVVILFLGLQL
jgi:hypothetical protein